MNQAVRYSLRALAGTLLMFAFNVAVMAQCAMCRASLSGSNNARFIKSLNVGVLVLLTPPVAIFCSIFMVLRRYKASDGEATERGEASSNSEPK